ncbi:MAG: hypothetical protein IPM82_06980 [Saprospiraceae bacterium]|nr:hypothetical protein [Saprospiraceae bacterium]
MKKLKRKPSLIPTRSQFKNWSIPNKHTTISLIIGLVALFWGFFTFLYTPYKAEAEEKYSELLDEKSMWLSEKSELLQKNFELQIQCNRLSIINCESRTKSYLGYTHVQLKTIAKEVSVKSTDFLIRQILRLL